jgi:hypothetical protein
VYQGTGLPALTGREQFVSTAPHPGPAHEGSAINMTRLMTRIRPLTSPIHRVHFSRRPTNRPVIDMMATPPGADERLVSRSELDQLRRTLPNRIA